MRGWVILAALAVVIGSAVVEVRSDEELDSPLYLTQFIEQGNPSEAKRRSQVRAPWDGGVDSYAGYVTVNSTYNSNLFFWLFKTQVRGAPLLLWLNGGPGNPSTIGALLENGPLAISNDSSRPSPVITRAKGSWTTQFHMLYIDSPVGTGYSFTRDPAGQPRTTAEVMPSVYNALIQLYTVFPEYRNKDLYIGGQSYAGKYIPVLGKYIHDRNQESPSIRLPLRGIYVGSGLCDAKLMLTEFPNSLYYAGLISNKTRQKIGATMSNLIQQSQENGSITMEEFIKLFIDAGTASANGDLSNILGADYTIFQFANMMTEFLNQNSTRRYLHVGNATGAAFNFYNNTVYTTMVEGDLFLHTRHENAFLMDNYKVLHYSGNMDHVVSVAMTEVFLDRVSWSGLQQYREQVNNRWWSEDDSLIGWFAKVGNFTRVIVRNAGHYLPFNKPEAALKMMTNFVFDTPFKGDSQTAQNPQ